MSFFRSVAIVILTLAGSQALGEPLTAQQVAGDLGYFRDVWAPKDRSYTDESRATMRTFIDGQIVQAHAMDKADLALIFSQAAAFSGNDHTLIEIYHAPDVFHALPFSFWWFPEGAIVTRAHAQYRGLLGARIISVGGIPIEEAAARVDRYTPGIQSHKRYLSPVWLTRIEALTAVGLARDGTAEFEFELASGKRLRQKIGVSPSADPAALSPSWRASMVPGKGPDPWPHVLDGLKELPLYVQTPDEMSWKVLRDGSVLYVRSTSLSPYTDDAYAVQLKAYKMMDSVIKSRHIPGAVVVDLRYNEGGNFLNIANLATELVNMTAPAGRIYVITGRATNSAAIAFVALLKGGALNRTKIVGQGISDNPWFWSEGGTLTAPASGLPLHYADGFHDWAHGCSDLTKCYWAAALHGVKAGSLNPDIPIDMSYKDYVEGKDPSLDAVMTDLDKH